MITKNQIEIAAAAIGLSLGPPNRCSWNENYRPKVRWPQDYSEVEQTRLRNAATEALTAALDAVR